MNIKVLGTGCAKCDKLEKETINALAELDVEADLEKITEMKKIMEYDVMMTPALVINDKIKAAGKVPKAEELKKLIREEL